MDISKYLDLFISETKEHIKLLNDSLLSLEKAPDNPEAVNQVFRSFHTVKGMAATMGYDSLANLAHRAEDVLSEVRKGTLRISPAIIDYCLAVADFFEHSIETLKAGRDLPPVQGLLDKADGILRGEDVAGAVRERLVQDVDEIKIKMLRLDHLVNLINEFILARNRLMRIQARIRDADLTEMLEHLSRLIDEQSDEVMMMRMLPLSHVFDFFPRWVRDESRRLNKDVEFVIEGGDIEIDRSIIDDLQDPVLHLLRNALDHGIDVKGCIKLVAHRERDFVTISVEDNGKGIELGQLREAALKRGIVKPSLLEKMTDHDVLQLIFRPNFSTRQIVTGLSGRGVGMNAVKKAVEDMRGEIKIETAKGQGTKFTITLPVRMATIKVMVFRLGDELYCLPLVNVIETFNVSEDEILKVHHREMVIFRNENLPVIRLKVVLGLPGNGVRRHAAIVAMLPSEKRAILVDNIVAQEELIVKPLDPLVKNRLFGGVSIYSDGRPSLILEPRGLE